MWCGEEGSLDWDPESNELDFQITDGKSTLDVHATGAPQMFREGIGVVVEVRGQGYWWRAILLMVKHSNEYGPRVLMPKTYTKLWRDCDFIWPLNGLIALAVSVLEHSLGLRWNEAF